MKPFFHLVTLLLIASTLHAAAEADPPEPGPENAGLRMRLSITPSDQSDKPGFDVRIDILNVSATAITLVADWRDDTDAGDLKDYIDAATSIETYPPVMSWIGGARQGQRTAPQPTHLLKPGEVLSAQWRTDGPCLKNRVLNPNEVQNPQFPFPGLYSIHANTVVHTTNKTVRLRSNEVLLPIGNSREMPKYTFGHLHDGDATRKTATLNLGSLNKVEVGDQFSVVAGGFKGNQWRLTITGVRPDYSFGTVEPEPLFPGAADRQRPFPEKNHLATFIPKK